MTYLITGLFETQEAAESAIAKLELLGYSRDEIDVFMGDEARHQAMGAGVSVQTVEGLGLGAVVGALLAAGLAGLLATGSISIPDVGLPAASPIAAILSVAGAGGFGGALLGGLLGASLPAKPASGAGRHEIVVAIAPRPEDEGRVRRALRYGTISCVEINPGIPGAGLSTARHDDLSLPLE